MSPLHSLPDVRFIDLPLHVRADGDLSVLEKSSLPLAVARLFFVRAEENATRGKHAHKRCNQLMVCVHGAIEVICDDGLSKRAFVLNRINAALFVPASIWASENYLERQSVLMVACDREYEEDDYIRSYDEFQRFRRIAEQ